MTDLVLLAVSRMASGVCIGGVEPEGGPWIRPVKSFGCPRLADIRFNDGSLMQPFDVVGLNLLEARPAPPHREDMQCDFLHPRPHLRRHLDEPEREDLLRRCHDPRPADVWCSGDRSLTLFEPLSLTAAFVYDVYSRKYETRIAWPGYDRAQGAPVTDLKWRALGWEWVLQGPHHQQYDREGLRRRLGVERIFLAVGLSRSFQGQFWPMVVGVHTLPDYVATVDERRL